MYYYLIIALQGFCVYHWFVNKNAYYWFFIIFFIPVIGSIIYLFANVIQKKDLAVVQDTLTTVIHPTKKIVDLENKFKFAATFENQVALADAFLEAKMYDKAILNYEAALKDVFQNDFYVISGLVEAHYFSLDFDTAISWAEKIKDSPKFKKSRASFLYALAQEKNGNLELAKDILEGFDAPYSRYQERLELAKFYIRNAKTTEARVLLEEFVKESEGMSEVSYRQNKNLIKKAVELVLLR